MTPKRGTSYLRRVAARKVQQQGCSASLLLIVTMSAHGSNDAGHAIHLCSAAVVQMARLPQVVAEWGSRADVPLIRVNSVSPGVHQDPHDDAASQWPRGWESSDGRYHADRLSEAHEYTISPGFLMGDEELHTSLLF
ncbi:hypothetical protein Cob_v011396 [Colletotrichum orbiculare MAFF 240422]|uniref:Uncharacterized protein n=1 Tax=Colletotrichum orbiculare (strain 104-T / ATCC 96160 / CBS 514.97 / LARS 414 / MAFF 240422) TaxID=1213857 RepID=A0A484FCM5_COLOR|nr:hypothetical protein Cob_v011396 [Colletotrichum orbiculare MAFF 240422]